jgi:hypothetical protein
MTRDEAMVELHRMITTIDTSDTEAAAARLLERVSCRADSLELRAALVEAGARALLRAAVRS